MRSHLVDRAIAAGVASIGLLACTAQRPLRESDPLLACPQSRVVTVVNPNSLEYDVLAGDEVIGTLPPNTTATFPIPPKAARYVRVRHTVLQTDAPIRRDVPLRDPRIRVHCAGT